MLIEVQIVSTKGLELGYGDDLNKILQNWIWLSDNSVVDDEVHTQEQIDEWTNRFFDTLEKPRIH